MDDYPTFDISADVDRRECGAPPIYLGRADLCPTEMMFWLYCPIKLSGSDDVFIPDNLKQFAPIVDICREDAAHTWRERFVYITAKTLWCTPHSTAQRPGWHCDGYMTDDINYVWSDSEPTLFCVPHRRSTFSPDHNVAIKEMEMVGDIGPHLTYPVKSLLRLNSKVLHRVNDFSGAGVRAFVKVSTSRSPFNLVGNSINHALPTSWAYSDRRSVRNPENSLVDTGGPQP